MNPRERVVRAFSATEALLPLTEILQRYGVSNRVFSDAPILDALYGLSPDDAFKLLEFYGAGALFNDEIERTLREYVLTRTRIADIENKRKPTE